LFGYFLFLPGLRIEFQNVAAHPLVLLNERQIPDGDEQQPGAEQQHDDNFCQFAPNTEVNVHRGELNTSAARAKEFIWRIFPHFQFSGRVKSEGQTDETGASTANKISLSQMDETPRRHECNRWRSDCIVKMPLHR
jgi:hypothetical protein